MVHTAGATSRSAHRPDLAAKKSRSTVSSPIFACNLSRSRRAASSASWPIFGSNARAAWSATVACYRRASKAIFAFSAASIFRLVLLMFRSVYHDRTAKFQLRAPFKTPCTLICFDS